MSRVTHYIIKQIPFDSARIYACGVEDEMNLAGTFIFEHISCYKCLEAANGHAGLPGAARTRIATRPEVNGTAEAPKDNVNRPSHYTNGKVECIDAIDSAVASLTDGREAFYTAQVIKYVWRWKLKNGVEDLKKARWYLDRLIGTLK